MQAYWTLTRRELAGYFFSLTGYITIAAALFLMADSFVVLLVKLQAEPTPMPVTEMFYTAGFFWLILLLTTPVITMRLFALERFSGTFESLMTTPVRDLQVVLAKFTAAFVFYLVLWSPLVGCLWVVRYYTHDPAVFDGGAVASTFLGIGLLGCMFLSLGCCASALTRSQTTAVVISVGLGTSLFLLGYVADQLPSGGGWAAQVLGCFAFFDQMRDFCRGVVDTRPVLLYLSLTFFFLFLNLRIIESRRWK